MILVPWIWDIVTVISIASGNEEKTGHLPTFGFHMVTPTNILFICRRQTCLNSATSGKMYLLLGDIQISTYISLFRQLNGLFLSAFQTSPSNFVDALQHLACRDRHLSIMSFAALNLSYMSSLGVAGEEKQWVGLQTIPENPHRSERTRAVRQQCSSCWIFGERPSACQAHHASLHCKWCTEFDFTISKCKETSIKVVKQTDE